MSTTAIATATPGSQSLIARVAERFGVEPSRMMSTLKATAFRQTGKDAVEPTNEQMMALLVVAEQYGLNPWARELYAFPDKQRGIVPIVGVDGWIRIINSHPAFDGLEWGSSEAWVRADGDAKDAPEWIECVIHRKDHDHPVVVREYLDECYRPAFEGRGSSGSYKIPGPWQTHTKRMLRHKALIQCARVAFGFAGIYDPDEGQRVIEGQYEEERPEPPRPARRPPARLSSAPQAVAEPDPEPPADPEPIDAESVADEPEEAGPPSAEQLIEICRATESIESVIECEDLARELRALDRNRVKAAAADARRRLESDQ